MPQTTTRKPIEVALPEYGVYLLESHHAPGFRMQEEEHSFLELFYVLKGSGQFDINGETHPCHRQDVVVVPPRHVHLITDDTATPLSLFALCVSRSVVLPEQDLFERLPVGRVRMGKAVTDDVRASFRRLLFEQTRQRPFGPTLITGLTMQLLASLARSWTVDAPHRESGNSHAPSAERRASVQRYVAALAHRFYESMSLDDAAAELGMSRRRFTTLFHDVTGKTWAGYLTEQRIKYAKTLLKDTTRSIVSIAFECGYEDLSSFYRSFKATTGDSPGEWRERQPDG